jgi:hypothetical protein
VKNIKDTSHEEQISLGTFLDLYNKNMPSNYPRVSEEQLLRFRKEHATLFKNGKYWSLDQHRKKIIDWLPQNEYARQD